MPVLARWPTQTVSEANEPAAVVVVSLVSRVKLLRLNEPAAIVAVALVSLVEVLRVNGPAGDVVVALVSLVELLWNPKAQA